MKIRDHVQSSSFGKASRWNRSKVYYIRIVTACKWGGSGEKFQSQRSSSLREWRNVLDGCDKSGSLRAMLKFIMRRGYKNPTSSKLHCTAKKKKNSNFEGWTDTFWKIIKVIAMILKKCKSARHCQLGVLRSCNVVTEGLRKRRQTSCTYRRLQVSNWTHRYLELDLVGR